MFPVTPEKLYVACEKRRAVIHLSWTGPDIYGPEPPFQRFVDWLTDDPPSNKMLICIAILSTVFLAGSAFAAVSSYQAAEASRALVFASVEECRLTYMIPPSEHGRATQPGHASAGISIIARSPVPTPIIIADTKSPEAITTHLTVTGMRNAAGPASQHGFTISSDKDGINPGEHKRG